MRMESGSAVDRCPRCGCGIRVECDLGQAGATFVLYGCGALVAWVQDAGTGEWEILRPLSGKARTDRWLDEILNPIRWRAA